MQTLNLFLVYLASCLNVYNFQALPVANWQHLGSASQYTIMSACEHLQLIVDLPPPFKDRFLFMKAIVQLLCSTRRLLLRDMGGGQRTSDLNYDSQHQYKGHRFICKCRPLYRLKRTKTFYLNLGFKKTVKWGMMPSTMTNRFWIYVHFNFFWPAQAMT